MASRFARIALGHVRREFPNKLDHVLTGPADLKRPRALHPVFFGSFDWHSSVHSYWLLATLYRLYPAIPEAAAIRTVLAGSLTDAKIGAERAYLKRPSAGAFERPYGWAWALMLQAELIRHRTAEGKRWCDTLRPLAADFTVRFRNYLPKATYPIRAGTHGNTAFALVLAREYAVEVGDGTFADLLRLTARGWYGKDADCRPFEPGGEDFLSPVLIEALCMQRMLPPRAFRAWLARFLPLLAKGEPTTLFTPVHVSDRTDGRIAHLDGLNLSRAWCWRALAEVMPQQDASRGAALRAAERHLSASLPFIAGSYMGEHWLASFALLALRPAPGP
jgi:hypothetical protein